MNDVSRTNPIFTDKKDYTHHAITWETSKLSQSTYCAEHDLDYSRLVTARSKLLLSRGATGQQKKPVKFIPVRAKQAAREVGAGQSDKIIIRLAKGSVIELPVDVGTKQLATIFKALGHVR